MSDIQGVMKFELLPTEILFLCFEYLNVFEIFHSFDRLNYRFYKFIRNIPLQLNFQNVRKTTFDQFCTKMLSNSEIKRQICSLKLSNKDTCGQIEAFLSNFSLNAFSHLRSLTLVEVEEQNVSKLKPTLPLISKLLSFHTISYKIDDNEILSVLPMSNLQTLSMLSLHSIQTRIGETLNITNLTIHSCSLEHLLYYLFKYFPMLKYLNVRFISRYNHPIKNDTKTEKHNGVHLKQLIIDLFKYNFEEFKIFIKQIPNLRSLTIDAKGSMNMIDASKWQYLIQSSLLYLNIFKFKFGCDRGSNDKIILDKFKQFQGEFWCKQHQWFTEYSFEKYLAFIYTIPYISISYKLDLDTKRFPNQSMNNSNTFSKVTYVTLDEKVVSDECQYHFSNVESLALRTSKEIQNPFDIYNLKMIVNLSNLNHLNISEDRRMLTSSFLLEILKESPKLSWMTIKPSSLILLFNDDELCKYLKNMIKRLDIVEYAHPSFNNSDEIKKFCEIFSNIEQLTCYIQESNDILFLLNQLSKLSTTNIRLSSLDHWKHFCSLFEQELSHKLNCIFRVQNIDLNAPKLSMWIGEKYE